MQNTPPRDFVYAPPHDPLDILHHDTDIIVLNKPSGLLSVSGRLEEHKDSLELRAQREFPQARIIHRLDMDTSGVIIMAMNADSHRHVSKQFEKRQTDKTYIARVAGLIEENEGLIDQPLICDWPNRPKQMICHENGKPSQTKWNVLERETEVTRVALYPITGRTHQLRVHMRFLGHPILGDDFYAPPEIEAMAPRLQLHAKDLTLHHPDSGERVTYSAPVPF